MEDRKQYANAIRAITMDAIDKSQSGHPGAPMGMANIAESLWRKYYKHNPSNPSWINRDRFVLSNGHASMLIYSLLHLSGYDLSMDDIKNFRQLHSKTPGHPESDRTPGIDFGTGPLGQGVATAVGMALAEKHLAHEFNRPNHTIMDHYTWVFLGDGCLMEGITQEAISLAGTWKLNKLIAIYDANDISIDGKIEGWFTEDVAARFEACHWNTIDNVDGHDPKALDIAIEKAMSHSDKPTIIICKTTIGYGSPKKAGSSSCHGSPMGKEENLATRTALGWTHAAFEIPKEIYQAWDAKKQGEQAQNAWQTTFDAYTKEYPDLAQEFNRRMQNIRTPQYSKAIQALTEDLITSQGTIATRNASKYILDVIAPSLPEFMGGSADLSGSVGLFHNSSINFNIDDYSGNYIHYGVREFGMSAIMNGLSVHGGFIPYGGTFMVFSDYAKNAIRLAAISKTQVIWVLTHDSIGVGEDGPTHQPIEQISALRLTPHLNVWRPADLVESAIAWQSAIENTNAPTCLSMSRHDLPPMPHTKEQLKDIAKGGYVLFETPDTTKTEPQLILIATGSEVSLVKEAGEKLAAKGIKVRVVSMPCTEIFDAQDDKYKESVLPKNVRARIAVEAGSKDFWYKYVGLDGIVIGMSSYGESAPGNAVFAHFGFTVENIINKAQKLLGV